MKNAYIYGLVDPRTGLTRYVGKSADPHHRFKKHLYDSRNNRTYRDKWILSLKAIGLAPELIILEGPCEDWEEAERKWIASLRPQLTNHTNGGEGWDGAQHSEASREKNREAQLVRFANDPALRDRAREMTLKQFADPVARKQASVNAIEWWSNADNRTKMIEARNDPARRSRHSATWEQNNWVDQDSRAKTVTWLANAGKRARQSDPVLSCSYCGLEVKGKGNLAQHQRHCTQNPKRNPRKDTSLARENKKRAHEAMRASSTGQAWLEVTRLNLEQHRQKSYICPHCNRVIKGAGPLALHLKVCQVPAGPPAPT